MIEAIYNNNELKKLVKGEKSNLYKELARKKSFMDSLRSFFTLLNIYNETSELCVFIYLQYTKKKFSSVLIKGTGFVKRLIFSEHNNGRKIIILDLT